MRRGRGKGKKLNTAAAAAREEGGSGEEEKIPAHRRRGRPQKPVKDDTGLEEPAEKIEEGSDIIKSSITGKDLNNEAVTENGRKRKRSMQTKEHNAEVTKEEENGVESKSRADGSVKSSIGYRQNGSRRKNKPRRAAEAVIECYGF
ncbi:PREDICTED: uncharacterized protein LOC104824468 [Tarenaya hassleriana]|uniref:uncharacterized protein LOC104824468 n=1 Tax=Tarenaya hassleriana TaxID=28532 RepID=UPI00053C4460|nr:PREDICTED: uncharacterized protein LOC104824468 [Tarenaya hassleriana]